MCLECSFSHLLGQFSRILHFEILNIDPQNWGRAKDFKNVFKYYQIVYLKKTRNNRIQRFWNNLWNFFSVDQFSRSIFMVYSWISIPISTWIGWLSNWNVYNEMICSWNWFGWLPDGSISRIFIGFWRIKNENVQLDLSSVRHAFPQNFSKSIKNPNEGFSSVQSSDSIKLSGISAI